MASWNEWVTGANMTLSEVLDALKSATIGLDVKDKLFWSYYKIVELAIKEGNANFDVAKAAGRFKDLASRLDASDQKLDSNTAQLAQTARKDETGWANFNTFDEPTRATLQGLEPGQVNAVLGVKNVLNENIGDKEISANKTDFLEVLIGVNKFDKNDENVLIGNFIGANGDVGNNASYALSGYIPVEPNTSYNYNPTPSVRVIGYYDEDLTFISAGGVTSSTGAVSPSNTKYARFNLIADSLDTTMFYKEVEKPSSYVPYTEKYAIDNLIVLNAKETAPYRSLASIMGKFVTGEYTQLKVLGDSTVHGVGGTGYDNTETGGGVLIPGTTVYTSPNSISWANYLRDYMSEKFNATVVNYGVSGYTSSNILSNINNLVTTADDVVLISIGINDRQTTKGSTTDFYNRLLDIAQIIHGQGKEVIFMAPQPVRPSNDNAIPNATYNFTVADVANLVTSVNGELNQQYINMYNFVNNYCKDKNLPITTYLYDILHPNDAGYDLIFKRILYEFGFGDKPFEVA